MALYSRVVPACVLGVTLLAPLGAAVTAAPADAAGRPTCHGLRATIVGTPRNDRLVGTPHRDVIVGLGGNDTIKGLGGGDVLCGGDGADKPVGGPGRDRLYGGRAQFNSDRGGVTLAPNVLDGGPGRDLLDPGRDGRRVSDSSEAVAGVLDYHRERSGLVLDLSPGGVVRAVVGGTRDRVVVRPRMQLIGTSHADTTPGAGGATTSTWAGATTPSTAPGATTRSTVRRHRRA